jgi:hypothetical protein
VRTRIMVRISGRDADESGSVLVLSMVLCLGLMLLIGVLAGVLRTGEAALLAEARGRSAALVREEGLEALADAAAAQWIASDIPLDGGGRAWSGEDTASPLCLRAAVRAASSSETSGTIVVEATVEQGRDGLDLPAAALTAGRLFLGGRSSDAAVRSADGATPRLLVADVAGITPGPSVEIVALDRPWELDDGWRRRLEESAHPSSGRVLLLAGNPGQEVRLPSIDPAATEQDPVLVVVTGGADLDATYAGSLAGVLVVDGGSLRLEGTRLEGSAACTGTLDLGETGFITLRRSVLRWATDRSLRVARLTPGTRSETVAP